MIAFGPVPSRRLGRSLGVNNVPFKSCSYSCVYCQLGRTPATVVERRKFFEPEEVLKDVEKRISDTRKVGEAPVDFITFVPDGEPTLDINLGREIDLLKPLGIRIAIYHEFVSHLAGRRNGRSQEGRLGVLENRFD